MVGSLIGALGLTLLTVMPAAAEDVTRVCRFSDERLTEISGMTVSRLHPDVLWLHNDSSGGPYIYAVSAATCDTIARITVEGIDARDIEAIAAGRDSSGRPVLWIADIGDNLDSWTDVSIHRVREPEQLTDQVVTPQTFKVTYRDRPHNAEALLADPDSSQLWIVTKQLAHGRLYKLPKHLSPDEVNIAKPVQTEGGLVTDGAVSPDGSRYVLRDYINALIFVGLPPGVLDQTISLPIQPQGEAITWTSDGSALLIASERDSRLLRVGVEQSQAHSEAPTEVQSEEAATESPASEPSTAPVEAEGNGPMVPLLIVATVVVVALVVTTVVRSRSRSRR